MPMPVVADASLYDHVCFAFHRTGHLPYYNHDILGQEARDI
jgi:hypothetical protein